MPEARLVRETRAWLPGHSNRKQSMIHECDTLVGISRAPTIWNSSTFGEQDRGEIQTKSLTRFEGRFSMEDSFYSAPNTTWRGVSKLAEIASDHCKPHGPCIYPGW
jgi:hypothetical protein